MAEGTNMIEAEIAALNVQIQEKRSQLERERGSSVESGEALHHVVTEKINQQVPSFSPKPSTQHLTTSTSYLDDLDPTDTEKINVLIDMIPSKGLYKTIEAAKGEPAHILDAFHDALVDKLREELKRQNLI